MKLDILAFGAHPDDVELGCGATLAKEIDLGKKVGIIDLTHGELGTRGSAEIRAKEAEKAREILGVEIRKNLGFRDGFFTNDEPHQLQVIKMIRKYKPEIVLCNAIKDRHMDHPKASELISSSCFLSGLVKIKTSLNQKEQDKWRPKHVFHYIQWKNIEPDFVIDVTGYIDTKVKSVLAYSSQFFNESSTELETPITSKNFLESIRYRAKDLGRLINTEYAEGFTTERTLAINKLDDLI